jgi:hypothetical protein
MRENVSVKKKKYAISRIIRVYPKVEELVEEVSKKLGYQPFSVRNAAILYGLMTIVLRGMPEDDEEFFKLIELTRNVIRGVLGGEERT